MEQDRTNDAGVGRLEFPEELKARAREFFAKGGEVAYALNYDYAIDLYLEGLSYWPEAVEDGHKALREIALRRQVAGGKKSGFTDNSRFKKASGKIPKEAMLKAEYLFSKDPSNLSHLSDFVKYAVEGDYRETSLWAANMLFDFSRQKDKPAAQTFIFLRDSYVQIEAFSRALQACQQAMQLKSNDASLADSMRDLSAQAAMQQGRYDEEGDFRQSIRDREGQEKLQSQEQVIKSESVLESAIADARAEYEADPRVPGKIAGLVEALCATEIAEQENEAIAILEKAYSELGQFRHKQRSGEIMIKQLNRKVRQLQEQYKVDAGNEQLKKQLSAASQEVLATELKHYELCVASYPTDLRLKYQYGRRLLRAKEYDQAIPMFQEARSDPHHRIAAMNCIGLCFYHKEWFADAEETFEQALESVESAEGAMAKELRYNLGRAHEARGNIEEALNCFRKVAQIDYNYRDVRKRVDALRQRQQNK